MSIFRIAVVVFLVLATASGAALARPEKNDFETLHTGKIHPVALPDGKLAMVAFMLTGKDKSEKEWRETLRHMRALGVQVVEIGQIGWTDIERSPGKYDWSYAERMLKINKEDKLGLQFVADIGMFINPGLDGVPKLPAYLKDKAFDDPLVIKALSNLYRSFLSLPGAESVGYLFQHFENADASFKTSPSKRPLVQKLLRESFSAAKKIRPDIKTGVCIQSYELPHFREKDIVEWNVEVGTDVVPIISFDPSEFKVPYDNSTTMSEFEAIIPRTHGMPIAINECGVHSSPGAGSSAAKQSAFIKELYAVLLKHHAIIEFATWYELSDLQPVTASVIGAYLGVVGGNPFASGYFTARMGSRGLLTHDNKVKPSAKTWCEEAAKYYDLRAGRVSVSRP